MRLPNFQSRGLLKERDSNDGEDNRGLTICFLLMALIFPFLWFENKGISRVDWGSIRTSPKSDPHPEFAFYSTPL